MIAVFVVFWLLGALSSLFFSLREGSGLGSSGIPTNTTDRTAIESGYPYNADCIVDELGWFDDADRTGKKLEDFFKETGVQPYIVLLDYREELTTDSEKLAYAEEYVETHEEIDPYGNTFCYFYFAEENTDQDVGFMCYVAGSMTASVMDSEAIDIFWAYIDQYWYTNLSTDDMFVEVFNSTSERIMQRFVSWSDLIRYLIIAVIVIAACVLIIRLVRLKIQRDKKKAEEAKNIFEPPVNKP